jgi:imidazolonepropionase-like amidohydrolase
VLELEGAKMLFTQSRATVWMVFLWVASAVLCNSVEAEGTAFVGVNVISVEAGKVLEDQTVVVEDGRIVAVGSRASTAFPKDATEIDGTGKYLIPGLADMHIHLMNQEIMAAIMQKDNPIQPIDNMLYLYLANGVTTVRVMAGYPELLVLRDAIERGEVLGPRLIVTTPMFDGKKPVNGEPFRQVAALTSCYSAPTPSRMSTTQRKSKA